MDRATNTEAAVATTASREQFIRSWKSHIEELSGLVLQAAGDSPTKFEQELDAYNRIRSDLMAMLQRAAKVNYGR